jgi:hypothetical protein
MCNLFFLGAYTGQEVQNPEGGHVRPRHDLPETSLQPQRCAGGHQERRQVDQGRVGKTRFFFKTQPASPVGFLCFFVFLGFFSSYICPEERVFRVFSDSRILLGASRP